MPRQNFKQLTADEFIDALDSVTWYNGLAEHVHHWKGMITIPFTSRGFQIFNDEETANQIEVIWMMAVELFGDYGTSPRTGWIEDIEGFHTWIDRITQTWRDDNAKTKEN